MSSKENPLSSLLPEEYLEKTGVSTTLKDLVTSLIENRPSNPIHFISDYLKTSSTSGVLKSYKQLKLSKYDRKCFMDNLVSAYMNLDNKRGGLSSGITGIDYMKILKMICLDFPQEVVDEVLAVVGKRDTDIVCFEEFSAGIHAVLMYEEFFAEAEELFVFLDQNNGGLVETQKILAGFKKVGGNKSFPMPSFEEIKSALERVNLDERQSITFPEFCLALFKVIS
jgi:Ca2+-binding EF-hand superfamily protein